jgi:anti-sigma factor RsiW
MPKAEHARIRELLQASVEGSLTAQQEARVRSHIQACPACAMQAQVWARVVHALAAPVPMQMSPAQLARVAALARARRQIILQRRVSRFTLGAAIFVGWCFLLAFLPIFEPLVRWFNAWLHIGSLLSAVTIVSAWWLMCLLAGLGVIPLLRAYQANWRESLL